VQVISPVPVLELPVLELGESEALRWTREEAARPFDLSVEPVLRATLIRLGEEEHLLVVVMHHIATDGWSMGVFVRELAALYAGESSLPELPVQYADYAVWQRQWLQGDVLEEQLGWGRERLSGVPAVLDLPTAPPRPAGAGVRR